MLLPIIIVVVVLIQTIAVRGASRCTGTRRLLLLWTFLFLVSHFIGNDPLQFQDGLNGLVPSSFAQCRRQQVAFQTSQGCPFPILGILVFVHITLCRLLLLGSVVVRVLVLVVVVMGLERFPCHRGGNRFGHLTKKEGLHGLFRGHGMVVGARRRGGRWFFKTLLQTRHDLGQGRILTRTRTTRSRGFLWRWWFLLQDGLDQAVGALLNGGQFGRGPKHELVLFGGGQFFQGRRGRYQQAGAWSTQQSCRRPILGRKVHMFGSLFQNGFGTMRILVASSGMLVWMDQDGFGWGQHVESNGSNAFPAAGFVVKVIVKVIHTTTTRQVEST